MTCKQSKLDISNVRQRTHYQNAGSLLVHLTAVCCFVDCVNTCQLLPAGRVCPPGLVVASWPSRQQHGKVCEYVSSYVATAARRLHTLLNYLVWQINLFLKPFYLTVINHVLHRLLPNNKISMYYLRSRAHHLTLTSKSCFYDNCNFITRMLFKGTY